MSTNLPGPIHREVARKLLEGVMPASGQPLAVILAGGPGSGKSTLSNLILSRMPGAAYISVDVARTLLPAFATQTDRRVPGPLDADAKIAVNLALAKALTAGMDLIYDTTFGGAPSSREALLRSLRSYGYDVELYAIQVPTETAIARVASRAANSRNRADRGRVLPTAFVAQAHFESARNVLALQHWADSFVLLDNATSTMQLALLRIGSRAREVYDEKSYEAFQLKGAENPGGVGPAGNTGGASPD